MQPYLIWLIAAAIFVLAEIFTPGFVIICFGIGCAGGSVASLCGASLNVQIVIALLVSLFAFFAIRPFALKVSKSKNKDFQTNADAIIGRRAVVSERINANEHTGRVAVDGDDWKALSADGECIEAGETVEIVSRDSVIVTVKKIN